MIETLKDMEPGRKCFRSVGGVLVERTVQEVLPALRTNTEKVHTHFPHNAAALGSHANCWLCAHSLLTGSSGRKTHLTASSESCNMLAKSEGHWLPWGEQE